MTVFQSPPHLQSELPKPAVYRPWLGGKYDVKPGLGPITRELGNGNADRRLIQLDTQFPAYRAAKLRTLAPLERPFYVCIDPQFAGINTEVQRRLAAQAAHEYPLRFSMDGSTLKTAEGQAHRLDGSPTTWDALVGHMQEDVAVVQLQPDGLEATTFLHLCSPNHWDPVEKVGRPFTAVHAPVAGIESVNKAAPQIVKLMVNATEPLVRFAWGLATDDTLNHHPSQPPGRDWTLPPFAAFVRYERQVIWGQPDLNASLFFIRTYFEDVLTLPDREPEAAAKLAAAIRTMTPESRVYKGVAGVADELADWFDGR